MKRIALWKNTSLKNDIPVERNKLVPFLPPVVRLVVTVTSTANVENESNSGHVTSSPRFGRPEDPTYSHSALRPGLLYFKISICSNP